MSVTSKNTRNTQNEFDELQSSDEERLLEPIPNSTKREGIIKNKERQAELYTKIFGTNPKETQKNESGEES